MYQDDEMFLKCIDFVMHQECRTLKDGTLDDGYVNNPNDPGGETKYGISKKAYPMEDITNMSRDRAFTLYYRDYWPCSAGLDYPLSLCVFDAAVNQGTKRAKQWLSVCGGDWQKFMEQRLEHYKALYYGFFRDNPERDKFRAEWDKRMKNLNLFIKVGVAEVTFSNME